MSKVCGLVVRVGLGKARPFTSLEDVSVAYRKTIETIGVGASEAPPCVIINLLGQVVAHCSYNGRIWPGRPSDWTPEKRPLYEPL